MKTYTISSYKCDKIESIKIYSVYLRNTIEKKIKTTKFSSSNQIKFFSKRKISPLKYHIEFLNFLLYEILCH